MDPLTTEDDVRALVDEVVDTYEGLLARARAQRMVGDKKAWAKEATAALIDARRRQ